MTLKIQGLIFDEPPGVWVFCPINPGTINPGIENWAINPRCFCILADKPTVLNSNFFPLLVWTYPVTASVRCTSPPRAPVTSESLETVLQSGGSCQENKRILVKIHPQRKRDPTSGQKKNQTEDKSVFANQSGDPERLRLVSKVEGCGDDFVQWRPRF